MQVPFAACMAALAAASGPFLSGGDAPRPTPNSVGVDELASGQEAATGFDEMAEDVLALQTERRIEQLSARPRIYQVDHFLSDEECRLLRAWDRHDSAAHVARHPAVAAVHRRMHWLARLPPGHGEQLQVHVFRAGEEQACHSDSVPISNINIVRVATVIVYLSDVDEGGELVFPMGEDCGQLSCCLGNSSAVIRVQAKRGRALLFYSHDVDGEWNALAEHCVCPVLRGQEWIAEAWFRPTLYSGSPQLSGLSHTDNDVVALEQHEL